MMTPHRRFASPRARRAPGRRGGLLLEVLLAIVIMAMMLGLMGSQLVSGLRLVQHSDVATRSGELADRLLALIELDQEMVQRVFNEQQQEGDFGRENPGYFWRIALEPTDVAGLGRIRIDILHDGKLEAETDIRNARIVASYMLLKAEPAQINLAEDFGVSEEQLAGLGEVLPTLGLDPEALDPRVLANLSPEVLLALLPQLMPLIQQLLGGQFQGSGPGGEFTIDDLVNLRDQLGGEGGEGAFPPLPGGPPGAGGGRGGGQGPGADGGQPPMAGSGPGGEWTIDDLLDLQENLTGERGPATPGAGPGGSGGGRGAGGAQDLGGSGDANVRPGGGRGAGGGNPPAPGGNPPLVEPSGVDENGNPQYTIEDLLRLRDELNRRGQGG